MAAALQIGLPLDAIERLCRKYQVAELSVFGSALRPDFRKDSDIDLLVLFQPKARIGLEFWALERELSEVIGRKVDLVPKEGLKPLIRDEVREGHPEPRNGLRVVGGHRKAEGDGHQKVGEFVEMEDPGD